MQTRLCLWAGKVKARDNAETLRALRVAEFGRGRAKARPYNSATIALGFGFVLVEPACYVQHFGDVVAGAAADAVRLFRNADEHGVDVQEFKGGVKLLSFGDGGAGIGFAGHEGRGGFNFADLVGE